MSDWLLADCYTTFDHCYRYTAVATLHVENGTHGAHAGRSGLYDEGTVGVFGDMKQRLTVTQCDEALVRVVAHHELTARSQVHDATVRECYLAPLSQLGGENRRAEPGK